MDNTLVEQFIQYIRASRGLSERTAEVYGKALRHLSAFCTELDEGLTWQTLDTDILRRWLSAYMERGVQARTVRPLLAAVRTFYHYLLREGHVSEDPAYKLLPPKVPKTLPSFLKRSEVDRLLHSVAYADTFMGHRDRAIMATLCTTGIRAGEILGLQLADVDLQEGQLKVTGKRNKQRIVPFSPELAATLEAYLAARRTAPDAPAGQADCPAFFLSAKGKPMRYEQLWKVVRGVLGSVTSLKKRSPHTLRHTFATIMLDNGGDLEAIQQLLGHESVATTEIYTHTSFAELREQYAKAHPHARKEE